MDDSVILCDEIIESYDEEAKVVSTNFNENKMLYNTKFLYFTFIFINCYSIIDRVICFLINIEQNKNTCYHFT